MRFTLRQLEYLVAAADTGTFTAAANRCHVSQAGIALAITELERALGVQLLVRRKAKGVKLTPAGQRALTEARALLDQAEALESSAAASGGRLSGHLRVGCYTTLAPFFIPPLLDGFAARHPLLRLEFTEGVQPDLQRLLLDGALEVALLYDRGLQADIEHRPVTTLHPYVLLPADHPLGERREVDLAELNGEPLIRLDLPPNRGDDSGRLAADANAATGWYRTPNFELVRCLVGRGLGYAVLVQQPAGDLTYDGHRVITRPIADAAPVALVLAYPRGARLTKRAVALGEFCATVLDRQPGPETQNP